MMKTMVVGNTWDSSKKDFGLSEHGVLPGVDDIAHHSQLAAAAKLDGMV